MTLPAGPSNNSENEHIAEHIVALMDALANAHESMRSHGVPLVLWAVPGPAGGGWAAGFLPAAGPAPIPFSPTLLEALERAMP